MRARGRRPSERGGPVGAREFLYVDDAAYGMVFLPNVILFPHESDPGSPARTPRLSDLCRS